MADTTFNKIVHAAVRRDLGRFRAALDRFVAGDHAHAAALADMYDHFDHELTSHHRSEDAIIWPLVDGAARDSVLMDEMEAEHRALAAALASARHSFAKFGRSASAADASAVRADVDELERVAIRHLDHEERDLDPLVERVDEARWKAAQKQLRKGRKPAEVGWMFQWLGDAAAPQHTAHLQSLMPPPVRFVFDRLGRKTYVKASAAAWGSSARSSLS